MKLYVDYNTISPWWERFDVISLIETFIFEIKTTVCDFCIYHFFVDRNFDCDESVIILRRLPVNSVITSKKITLIDERPKILSFILKSNHYLWWWWIKK